MSSTAAGLAVSTPQIEERLQNFALFLRENDITPGPAAIIDAAHLCREGFLIERQLLKHGLRSCFCHCADDWHRFEELFEIYDQNLRDFRAGFMELHGNEVERKQKAIEQIDTLLAGLTYNRFF